MKPIPGIVEMGRFRLEPHECSYLPQETASLEYRIIRHITAEAYGELLRRGWRRFGGEFFRPACPHCCKCRSLRIKVNDFRFSRTHLRTLKRNENIRVVLQPPSITEAHLALYNAYHQDMHLRRGWRLRSITRAEYESSFLRGNSGFAHEILYYSGQTLSGVALVDLVPDAISSVYFFCDPEWRQDAPGVFSVLQTLKIAREKGLRYQYLGYWIQECGSMAYKSQYRPHELLDVYPADDEEPAWKAAPLGP